MAARARATDERAAGDVLTAYLAQVGQHRLLTAEEEVELAQAMEAGRDAADRLDQGDGLGDGERTRLRRLVRRGEEARRRFLNANLRLVVSQARRYRNLSGMEFVDVIQEGNIGLMRAVDKFDWRKGFKFSTYATWWIRQAISRSVAEKSRVIRIPAHLHDKTATVHAMASRLQSETGRAPTAEELATETGLEPEHVEDALILQEALSLEHPVGEDGAALGDFIQDDGRDDPVEAAERVAVREELRAAIERLPARERRILLLRYGFIDGVPRALEEIGAEFGLTPERIRQIEKRSLSRLRHPSFGMSEEALV